MAKHTIPIKILKAYEYSVYNFIYFCKVFETLPTLRVRGYTNNKVVNLCKQHQISYISTFIIHFVKMLVKFTLKVHHITFRIIKELSLCHKL